MSISSSCSPTSSTMSASISPRSSPMHIQRNTTSSPRSASSMTSAFTYTQHFARTTSPRRDSTAATTYSSATQHRKQSIERPNAYISDADLWGIDDVDTAGDCNKSLPYLKTPPEPPRSAEQWLAKPVPDAVNRSWMEKRRVSGAARKAHAESRKK